MHCATARAQENDRALLDGKPYHDSLHYFYDPRPLEAGKSIYNLGLVIALLPAPIVEQEIPAPVIDFQYRHSLASWFSLYGSLSSNFFTNLLMLGGRLN